MFQGYTDETFEFFMAIRFNNNRDFFQANRDWYLRAVREPSLALAEALSPTIEMIDDELERRPGKAVCRINRDVRFSRDKSPYRDYFWISFKRYTEDDTGVPGVYFDFSDNGASYGMGFYKDNKPLIAAFRRLLITEPDIFLDLWHPLEKDFLIECNSVKRIAIPENLHPELEKWYRMKSFFVFRPISDFSLLKSPRLVDAIIEGFERLTPLYRYFREIEPETEENETKAIDPWKDFIF